MPNTRAVSARRSKSSNYEVFRQHLGSKREELLSFYQHDVRVGQETRDDNADDFADRANNAYNRELMFSLSTAERDTLIQVEEALSRLESGDFGECAHCGTDIPDARLEAVPWTRFCIRCQERAEKGMLEP